MVPAASSIGLWQCHLTSTWCIPQVRVDFCGIPKLFTVTYSGEDSAMFGSRQGGLREMHT